MALGLGADLVNIARGMMISVGCIMSQQCHLNTCPVGVATTDPKKEKGFDKKTKAIHPKKPYDTTSQSKKKFFSRQTLGNAKKLFRRKSI